MVPRVADAKGRVENLLVKDERANPVLGAIYRPASRPVSFCPIYAEFSQICLFHRKTELPIKYSTLHMDRNT